MTERPGDAVPDCERHGRDDEAAGQPCPSRREAVTSAGGMLGTQHLVRPRGLFLLSSDLFPEKAMR